MGSYGLETFDKIGAAITLSADGAPKAKAGGVTIAWAGVPALSADYTFKDTDYAYSGDKVIRYGTVVCRITAATDPTEIGKFMPYMASPGGGRTLSTAKGDVFAINETVKMSDPQSDFPSAITGGRVYQRRLLVVGYGDGTKIGGEQPQVITISATGGTFTITYSGQTTSGIAYNATAATVQTALVALSNIAAGEVTVTGVAGGPYTVTFTGNTSISPLTVSGASLTGGAGTAVVTSTAVTDAADLTALGIDAFVQATFLASLPMISFVTEN